MKVLTCIFPSITIQLLFTFQIRRSYFNLNNYLHLGVIFFTDQITAEVQHIFQFPDAPTLQRAFLTTISPEILLQNPSHPIACLAITLLYS